MYTNRITAMMAVAVLTGLIHTLGPGGHTDTSATHNAVAQNPIEPKPPTLSATPAAVTPAPAFTPVNDSLLTDMKVYPSF